MKPIFVWSVLSCLVRYNFTFFHVLKDREGVAARVVLAGGPQSEDDNPEEGRTHELLRARTAHQHPQGTPTATQKVIFIKESFDLKSPHFAKLAISLELEKHGISEVVFRKGDRGEYFYIVLEGIYYVETENQKDKRK